ncbi:hypothetical protein HELRODRAFT_158756 [Helobdella robusta]|uniref:WD repeat-containing protein 54 beta-propeller domain-containing protein n=1 Tax=Helobdella robusta TaxID=6412 RepID=T1EN78_HELRO|nr:hypothetical protein HELRODRAFT_158756 [Helobdella robusta]ESO12275.1 hypothetical protein HELRODRAFT_158756 [Helobdella robusta]
MKVILVTGTSYGEIVVLDVPRQGNIYKHRETLPSSLLFFVMLFVVLTVIWELICHKENIVAGTSDGVIIIFTFTQYPCTSLICFEDRILGSYGSGHLCLFDLKSGSLLCEIGAHARLINSLHLSHNDRMILSAGEDAYVRLWRLSENLDQVEHVCNVLVEDLLIQGAKFVGQDSSSFAVTGYDSHEIAFFKRS